MQRALVPSKTCLFLLFFSLVCAVCSHAATRYVATTGDDSRSCATATNIATPKQTIVSGLGCTVAGDTLYMRGGTYNDLTGFPGPTLPSGSSWSNPITLAGYPGETVVNTKSLIFGSGEGNKFFIAQDFAIVPPTTNNAAVFLGANYVRLLRMDIRGWDVGNGVDTGGNGVQITGNNHEILQSNIHADNNGVNRSHCFYIAGSNNVLDGNLIHHCPGLGVQQYHFGSFDSNSNVIKNNRIYSNGGSDNTTGLLLSSGTGNIAYNNLVYNNIGGSPGVVVDYRCFGCKVYNNTIYGNTYVGLGVFNAASPSTTNTELRNNIVFNNSVNTIQDAGVNTIQSNNLTSDPSFVNAGTADFRLQAGSTNAINQGVSLASVFTTDFAGNTRPSGIAWDIGAYEFGGVVGGTATQVRIMTEPTDAVTNQLIPEVVVWILDVSNNLVSTSSASVTLALGSAPSGATLGGTVAVTASGGKATFSTLRLPVAGVGYTVVASSSGLTSDTSAAFTVASAEWLPARVSHTLCSAVVGDSNNANLGSGSDYRHSLTCPLPAHTLSAGVTVRVCSLMQMVTGSTAAPLDMKLKLNTSTAVSHAANTPLPNFTNANSWICFQLTGTQAPGPTANVYATFDAKYASSLRYDTDSNTTPQPIVLPTDSTITLAVASKWGSIGTGTNRVDQLAFFVEVEQQ